MVYMENHDASSSCDAFGESGTVPRVGDEYQAELPQFLGDSNHSMAYGDGEARADSLHNFHTGSPIKLAWISSEQSGMRGSHDWTDEVGEDYRFVPEICDECWSESEKGSFLLGLYIFAKNFVEVKKFVGTKGMVSVQSYYYGTFHSSPAHQRWCIARRMKLKKRALGPGLFYGVRLQEFLSRVLPRVGERRNALLEVSKSFENERISVGEFAFALKAMIGAELLVEAVGIGRGQQDLSAMATRHSRASHDTPSRNMYTSLTTAEISSLLSGEHRLSKARSNDLFWDAVWPRLLASGWHSEQATSYRYVANSTGNHSLVFLIPGVKRFSRRDLVRGDQYFESVSDVLSKVTREPALLVHGEEDVDCSNEAEQCGLDASLQTITSADEATIQGKKRDHDEVVPEDQEARANVHKKRNTRDRDEGEASMNLDALPSTSSSIERQQQQPQLLIDLNVPLNPEDDGADQPEHKQDIIVAWNNLETGRGTGQTRYSTRQRPPTMRVLEAFASGYLSVNTRQKKKEDEQ